ncbi:MAG: hypothetical protein EOP61_09555 [Sphingomonadales bacterium]|nr:MAG: hypothetical protein EOP61_09555 [Sphingomonadales bacterium]
MAKADRLARLDERRIEAEAEYRAALVAALEVTAAGRWGLFGHNQDKISREAAAPTVAALCELGEEIDDMRDRLGLESFELHAEFIASRGRVGSHAVGEPKQAQQWLARLT